jgi:hypothetical protein
MLLKALTEEILAPCSDNSAKTQRQCTLSRYGQALSVLLTAKISVVTHKKHRLRYSPIPIRFHGMAQGFKLSHIDSTAGGSQKAGIVHVGGFDLDGLMYYHAQE